MFWSSQNSLCETQYIQKFDIIPKNKQKSCHMSFLQQKTLDTIDWRTKEKDIIDKLKQIDEQKKALIAISNKIKNNSFICGQDNNLSLIVSQISIKIRHSLNEVVEKINWLEKDIDAKMRQIKTIFKCNSDPNSHEITKINHRNNSYNSFQKNLKKQILVKNRSQRIDFIKEKVCQLQKQLVQTKENERKLTTMIENLSLYQKNTPNNIMLVENKIKRNCSQFKSFIKTQIRTQNICINPQSQIQKHNYSNKALQFKNTLSNAKNIKHQKINIIPKNYMKFLNQFVISQSQSINSSKTQINNHSFALQSQNQTNKVDEKALRKIFYSKEKNQRIQNFNQNRHQSQLKDFNRNKSQSNFILQRKFSNRNKQIMHEASQFLNNKSSKNPQSHHKTFVKDSKDSHNFFHFANKQLNIDNKNHRYAFLMNNLIN